MKSLLIERGNYTPGRTQRNTEGEVLSKIDPAWEPDDKGCCILVGDLDRSSDDPCIHDPTVFGLYQMDAMTALIKEKLGLSSFTVHDLEKIWDRVSAEDANTCHDFGEKSGKGDGV